MSNASNIQPALDALKKSIRQLGEQSGLGRDTREKLAIAMSRAAFDGIIVVDDVPDLVTEYLTSESKKLIHNHSANGRKVMESKCRKLVEASIPEQYDFPATLERAVDIRAQLRQAEQAVKPGFESFVDLARQTIALKHQLTDAEIEGIVRKEDKAEKDILQKLAEDYKRLNKRYEELPSASIEAAIHGIADAIKEAGGELPPLTKEEKKAADAIAFLRKTGRIAA